MAQYSKRGRNSNRRRQGGNNNPNRSMDSQGPEVKIRGTAAQIHDKYQALARDAFSSGDRIRGESLMQHAEHYYRLMKSMQPEKKEEPKRDEQAEQAPAEAAVEGATEAPTTEAGSSEETKDAAAEPEANSEDTGEAKPRRRRRRRRSDDGETASGDEKAADAPKLEEAAAE